MHLSNLPPGATDRAVEEQAGYTRRAAPRSGLTGADHRARIERWECIENALLIATVCAVVAMIACLIGAALS